MEASRLIILLNATCWFVLVSKPPAKVGAAPAIAMATQTNFSFFILINLNKNVRKGKKNVLFHHCFYFLFKVY